MSRISAEYAAEQLRLLAMLEKTGRRWRSWMVRFGDEPRSSPQKLSTTET